MATLIGNIGPFDENLEKFDSYVCRLQQFFLANDIKDARKAPCFLSIIGPTVFQKVTDLVHPKTPETCTYDELVLALKNHYKPKVIQIFERFKFYKRAQLENESVSEYVAALKSLASSCNFKNRVSEYLLDRFVVGLRDEATQRALLAVEDLDFDQALSVAQAREAAARDVREFSSSQQLQASANVSNTNKVSTQRFQNNQGFRQFQNSSNNNKGSKGKQNSTSGGTATSFGNNSSVGTCSGCGAPHNRSHCPFKNAVCHYCKKTGHIIKVCIKAKKKGFSNNSSTSTNIVNDPINVPLEYIFYSDNVEPFLIKL